MDNLHEIIPFNINQPPLFGLHWTVEEATALGLDTNEFLRMQKFMMDFCNKVIGNRALAYLNRGGQTIITHQEINSEFVDISARTRGVTAPLLHAIGDLIAAKQDMTAQIVADPNLITKLQARGKSVIHPRTITAETADLANVLKADHVLRHPPGIEISGIHPTFKFLAENPITKTNSKVRNFILLKELDNILQTQHPETFAGISFAPDGGVSFTTNGVVRQIKDLVAKGKTAMIKADLSVDGMGNIHFDHNELILDTDGVTKPFTDCTENTQANHIAKTLREHNIPIGSVSGEQVGVVVQEFLNNKILDPSLEFWTPPLDGSCNITEPITTNSCLMIIQNGGFAGAMMGKDVFDEAQILAKLDNLPVQISKDKYIEVMQKVRLAALEFAKLRQTEGYVGINDCDIAICLEEDGSLSAKILEFNFSRETGGTATEFLLRNTKSNFALALDAIKSFSDNLTTLVKRMQLNGVLFNPLTSSGVIILNFTQENGTRSLMPVIVGDSAEQALIIKDKLEDLSQKS